MKIKNAKEPNTAKENRICTSVECQVNFVKNLRIETLQYITTCNKQIEKEYKMKKKEIIFFKEKDFLYLENDFVIK